MTFLSEYVDDKFRETLNMMSSPEVEAIICIEELAELQKCITKRLRYGHDMEGNLLAEEIADVLICLHMLAANSNISREEIEYYISMKRVKYINK